RTMWGKGKSSSNPYRDASFSEIRGWLADARQILMSIQASGVGLGFLADFSDREAFSEGGRTYYQDATFTRELEYLKGLKGRPKKQKPYSYYHTVTTSPHIRLLAALLWRLDQEARAVGIDSLRVQVDRFSGAGSIDHVEVLR